MARGRFISFEGGEGGGKSTQSRLLCECLAGVGIEAIETREPGGSPGAEEIRALLVSGGAERWNPLSEALLHNAARHEHVARTIAPALARGSWVISDRFLDSTIAYQGYGQGVGIDTLRNLGEMAAGTTVPDLTLVLDLPVADGFARTRQRADATSRYEKMDREMHERIREGFLSIAKANDARCQVIDASVDANAVNAAVWQAVRTRFAADIDVTD
ncbi:MAG: dTMP kinase [Rhodospirillaceae bacterium]|nr:dTMP kinase [Rhodospirillaceae bacterium]